MIDLYPCPHGTLREILHIFTTQRQLITGHACATMSHAIDKLNPDELAYWTDILTPFLRHQARMIRMLFYWHHDSGYLDDGHIYYLFHHASSLFESFDMSDQLMPHPHTWIGGKYVEFWNGEHPYVSYWVDGPSDAARAAFNTRTYQYLFEHVIRAIDSNEFAIAEHMASRNVEHQINLAYDDGSITQEQQQNLTTLLHHMIMGGEAFGIRYVGGDDGPPFEMTLEELTRPPTWYE